VILKDGGYRVAYRDCCERFAAAAFIMDGAKAEPSDAFLECFKPGGTFILPWRMDANQTICTKALETAVAVFVQMTTQQEPVHLPTDLIIEIVFLPCSITWERNTCQGSN
jgi:hypothetical protein